MFFPIGTTSQSRLSSRSPQPWVTIGLIALHLMVMGVLASRGWSGDTPTRSIAGDETALLGAADMCRAYGLTSLSKPAGLITYQFVPQSAWAGAIAMFFLWTFGHETESRLGRVATLLLYLGGGALVGWLTLVLSSHITPVAPPSIDPANVDLSEEAIHQLGRREVDRVLAREAVIGFGGGLSALAGSFLALAINARVRTVVIMFMIGIFEIPGIWFLAVCVVASKLLLTDSGDIGYFGTRPWLLAMGAGLGLGFGVALGMQAVGLASREVGDLLHVISQKRRLKLIREAVTEAESRSKISRGSGGSSGATASASTDDQAMSLRAAVAEAVAVNDWKGGLAALRTFTKHVGDQPGRLTVSRRVHLALANGLLVDGKHAEADEAYSRFLLDHPSDEEAPHIQLLLALVRTKYLNKHSDAAKLIDGLRPRLKTPDDLALLDAIEDLLRPHSPTPSTPPTPSATPDTPARGSPS